MNSLIQTILVPQGAEYQAVCKGLRGVTRSPVLWPVAPGPGAVVQSLQRLYQAGSLLPGQTVVMMGLCGGLVPGLAVGQVVLYSTCDSGADSAIAPLSGDATLTAQLQQQLGDRAMVVKAVTSDRVISTVHEKAHLAQQFSAQVVDMEGFAALAFLAQVGVSVATLRVVSDDCHHDLPNLADAFAADGSLKPLALAQAFFRQPLPAARLIRGSLTGLKALQTLTKMVFASSGT